MAKLDLEIDVDDAVADQIAKFERKISTLEKKVLELTTRNTKLEDTMGKMKKAKDALLEAADWLDPFRYEDD